MTQPSNGQPPVADKIAEFVRKAIVPGGVTAGGVGAFWSLLVKDDVGQAVASAAIGLGLSYGATLLKPVHNATQRRAGEVGKRIDEMTEGVINAATGFEGKYLQCQSWDCESERSEGVAQRDGIWEPFLKDVFVELQIDADTYLAGYESEKLRRSNPQTFGRQSIWDLLAASEKNTRYRQLAILAWGGYGKTTLLRHVAYSYGVEKEGVGKSPSTAPRLIPVLLVLRKYSKVIAQENPPTLPELINEHHIPALPECESTQASSS